MSGKPTILRYCDDYLSVTFANAIRSPRTGTSEFTFAAFTAPTDPKIPVERLFWLERDGDTFRVSCAKTGRRTEIAWSQVREASRPPVPLEEVKARVVAEKEAASS